MNNNQSKFEYLRDKNDTIIVNITTYPKRDKFLPVMLKYFTKQTYKPNKIILWLSKDEYDKNNLPIHIQKCLDEKWLTDIMWVDKNIYCHKRHETFKYNNNAYNIFADDDIYYPIDYVEKLYLYSKIYNTVTAYFGKTMEYLDTTCRLVPFVYGPYIENRYYGGLSCIPPNIFPIESFDYEILRDKVCPKCDESWVQMWLIKKNIPIYNIINWKNNRDLFFEIEGSQKESLWDQNKIYNNGILKKASNVARCIVSLDIEHKINKLWPNFNIVKSCDGEYKQIKKIALKKNKWFEKE